MTATTSYRIAAGLFLLSAAAHTVGVLTMTPPTAEAIAVHDAMNNVHFTVNGSTFSYGGFYTGFGLFISAYLIFSAFLAWRLGAFAIDYPKAIGTLGWSFFGLQIVSVALALIYFSIEPSIGFGLLAVFTGWGAWQVQASKARSTEAASSPGAYPSHQVSREHRA